ncbi:hypothetical protein GBAR_LOCUS29333 [Geodia barretti]|uniref:Uncharacterized protein n=1 Tax=Geodia barretti TaxID=519541 RepID=A0AA35TT29_GEOBA|nr:hypothetical protein GBAR_LOCUS29333 [Geodia barretti]
MKEKAKRCLSLCGQRRRETCPLNSSARGFRGTQNGSMENYSNTVRYCFVDFAWRRGGNSRPWSSNTAPLSPTRTVVRRREDSWTGRGTCSLRASCHRPIPSRSTSRCRSSQPLPASSSSAVWKLPLPSAGKRVCVTSEKFTSNWTRRLEEILSKRG